MNKTITLRQRSNAEQLWALLKNNWEAMAAAGKPLAVSITEAKSKRSSQQNRYHWDRMSYLAENAWVSGQRFTKEAWHEYFADKFAAKKELRLPDGEIKSGPAQQKCALASFPHFVRRLTCTALRIWV